MVQKLKKKYQSLAPDDNAKGKAGKRNTPQWGTGNGRNTKRKTQKGKEHPIGFSGRSLSSR